MRTLATGFRRAARRSGLAALACAALCLAQARAAPLDWSVDITPGGELFPALDLSQTPRSEGDGSGLVAVRVTSDAPRALRVRIETEGLAEPAIVDARIERGTTELRPRLDWDRAELQALGAPRTQTLRVTLEAPGETARQREVSVRLHPLDDALYYVREGKARVDLGWVFAAYVDPHDPVVDEILDIAGAADDGGGSDPIAATRAVWNALESHGLRYASGDPALSRGPSIYSQRVRLLADSWESRRANCIDSSVLIASVLERIGVRSFIVLVPGHAFVGFYAGSRRSAPEFLETTVLGAAAPSGHAGFDAARAAGRARWNRVAARMDRRHRPDYALIDIETARSYGIIPLAAAGTGGSARPPASAPADSTTR